MVLGTARADILRFSALLSHLRHRFYRVFFLISIVKTPPTSILNFKKISVCNALRPFLRSQAPLFDLSRMSTCNFPVYVSVHEINLVISVAPVLYLLVIVYLSASTFTHTHTQKSISRHLLRPWWEAENKDNHENGTSFCASHYGNANQLAQQVLLRCLSRRKADGIQYRHELLAMQLAFQTISEMVMDS